MGNVELNRIDSVFNPYYFYLKNARITREYFDYYLHDLSSREAKDRFIDVCKRIISLEICERLALYNEEDGKCTEGPLYMGEGINGSKIGFRINTRPNWMRHYENDIRKYTDEGSSVFSEFYFITNQDIIPKVLFNNETKYLSLNKIQVHLFDRKWLIDKIFEKDEYMNIALDVFGLSKNLIYEDDISVYKSHKSALEEELHNIDELLNGYLEDNGEENDDNSTAVIKDTTINFDELDSKFKTALYLLDKMNTQFDEEDSLNDKRCVYTGKYKKILKANGKKEELKNLLFDCAVRYFFGDSSTERFIKCFDVLCTFLEEEHTSDLYEINTILWVMLRKLDATPEDRGGFLNRINAVYELIASEKITEDDEIKIAHANMFLSMYTKDEKSKRMDTYSKMLFKIVGHTDIRLQYFAMFFMEDRYYFSQKEELIEVCIDNFIKVLNDNNIDKVEIGKLYLKLALDATKAKKNDNMLWFNEALKYFNNEDSEYGEYLAAKTLYEIGKIFDQKKLFWLARNVYTYGLTKCIKLYEEKGLTSKIFIKLASVLKTVELSLGRVMYSTRFFCIENIIREINNENVGKSQDTYDFGLAVLIYKTPLVKLEKIGKLSRYFEKYGLYYSNIAVKHELGHYDRKLLSALENNKNTFDEYVAKWKQQPVSGDVENLQPWYGVEYKAHLKLDFMGCTIKIDVENKAITLEYASMLYAVLQSLLNEAQANEPQIEKITIYVLHDKDSMFNVNVTHSKIYETQFIVKIGAFDAENLDSQQQILQGHIVEFVNNIMGVIFRHKISFNKIKMALDAQDYLNRNEYLAAEFVNAMSVFGNDTFNYNLLTTGYDNILSNRSIDDVFPNQNLAKKILELKRRLRATFEKSDSIKEQLRHCVVDVHLWDEAVWDTVDIPNKAGTFPIIAFVFKNEKFGKMIFDHWIEKYSNEDNNNYIGIRVLKKIDASEPFKYRVVLGNSRKMYDEDTGAELETPVYTCTVSAENVAKLYTFERLMKTNSHYIICPAFYDEDEDGDGDGDIIYDWKRMIKKRSSSIKIANVYEIDMKDLLFTEGVFSTDKPVITNGEESVAILSLIEEKKVRVEVLNAALNMTEE
ncbi:MAG: hypothetical protein E7262_07680 [Lachnospiraceae bacterium]|nr:hypothetical protein [Lachnospiraceae bacterium]